MQSLRDLVRVPIDLIYRHQTKKVSQSHCQTRKCNINVHSVPKHFKNKTTFIQETVQFLTKVRKSV